jgi:hypothetical protein
VRKPAAPITELGKAIRERDAYLLEHDYGRAIKAACSGDVTRLINLLRAHRRPVSADTLSDEDLDRLAELIEATAKHGHRRRDASVHLAARMAETIMTMISGRVPDGVRTAAIAAACEQVQRETGEAVDAERVRDLLNRPKRRRRSPP